MFQTASIGRRYSNLVLGICFVLRISVFELWVTWSALLIDGGFGAGGELGETVLAEK
jgi:hypothetical protein